MFRVRVLAVLVMVVGLVGVSVVPGVASTGIDDDIAPNFDLAWGSSGTGEGDFDDPHGVAVDGAGNVYVVDSLNHRVEKFTSTGAFVSMWGRDVQSGGGGTGFEICIVFCKAGITGFGAGSFNDPKGVAVDGSGNVYVADTGNDRVEKFTSDGVFVSAWGWDVIPGNAGTGFEICTVFCKNGVEGTGDGQFDFPSGVAVDAAGNVYVTDTGNHRVQKFNSDGTFLTKWGSFGSGDGQFDFPSGVAVDAAGNVYVVESINYRVKKFTSTGTFLTKWGRLGAGDGQFDGPRGVAVDASGNVYVTESGNDRVQKFTSTGTFLIKWGSFGSGDGQFDFPQGVAVDGSGNVYVTDRDNHRVQKFRTRPVELVGDDAGLTIHNTSPTTAVRELLELVNNGAAQFVFTDSNTGIRWQFSQSGNGNFAVSRKGSTGPVSGVGGAELLVAGSGRVKMGPGGDTVFDLRPNGNLTIEGALTQNSDVNAKTNISGVDAEAVLEAVMGLPISEWSYTDDAGVRHVGPMAQDFYAAFGLGADETGIATLDTSGVALASIQALADQNQALGGQVETLSGENQRLQLWVGLLTLVVVALGLGMGVGYLRRRKTAPA